MPKHSFVEESLCPQNLSSFGFFQKRNLSVLRTLCGLSLARSPQQLCAITAWRFDKKVVPVNLVYSMIVTTSPQSRFIKIPSTMGRIMLKSIGSISQLEIHMAPFSLFRIFAFPFAKIIFAKKICAKTQKWKTRFFVQKLPKMD